MRFLRVPLFDAVANKILDVQSLHEENVVGI
jgi:hypothetical protein